MMEDSESPVLSPEPQEAYTVLAPYYDRLTRDIDYGRWADFLQQLILKHQVRRQKKGSGSPASPITSLLDLGCGTGSLAAELSRRGYSVSGCDLSADMLTVAAEKCPGMLLICQDMSRLRLAEPVDAVVCCLDSLNYLPSPAAVRRTFRSVYQALRPGGLFLFDVKTPLAFTSAADQINLDEDEDLFCVWQSEVHQVRGRTACSYLLDLFVQDTASRWIRLQEQHQELLWMPEELDEWLREAGFSHITFWGDLRLRSPRDTDMRTFITAGKDES